MAYNDNWLGVAMPGLARPPSPAGAPEGDGKRHVPVQFEALSDDGPFHRLTDAEAHRRVTFACIYYGCLAAALLVALVWH